MKKKFLQVIFTIVLTAVFIAGCSTSASKSKTDLHPSPTVSPSPDNSSKTEDFISVESVIEKLKSNDIPISYYIVYTDANDPNGTSENAYKEKGNFSDSRIEEQYDEYQPLSGSIEIFDSEQEVIERADYLQSLNYMDDFPNRIISGKILLRLNSNYSKEQVDSFSKILNGTIYSYEESTSVTPTPTPNPLDEYPLVTYPDIATGNYNGKNICIEGIVDNVDISSSSCSFSIWYPNGSSYIYDLTNSIRDYSEQPNLSDFGKIKNGDIIRYATTVYNDGSFGTSQIAAVKIVGEKNLDEVYTAFKNSCVDIDYETCLRNPDSYVDTICKTSGEIIQIVSESDYSAEYLISTSNGYIYATDYRNEENRSQRFLEGDNVVIYGAFSILKTYDTIIGPQNTIPEISAYIMELI